MNKDGYGTPPQAETVRHQRTCCVIVARLRVPRPSLSTVTSQFRLGPLEYCGLASTITVLISPHTLKKPRNLWP